MSGARLMFYKLFHSAAIIRHIKKEFGDQSWILMRLSLSKFKYKFEINSLLTIFCHQGNSRAQILFMKNKKTNLNSISVASEASSGGTVISNDARAPGRI